jgi:hypothetical protein
MRSFPLKLGVYLCPSHRSAENSPHNFVANLGGVSLRYGPVTVLGQERLGHAQSLIGHIIPSTMADELDALVLRRAARVCGVFCGERVKLILRHNGETVGAWMDLVCVAPLAHHAASVE